MKQNTLPRCHLHHVHLFASDLARSIDFYVRCFGGEVALDTEMAGARNVFIKIGKGRLHLYDQPPRNPGRGSIHHFGIQTADIDRVVERLRAWGIAFRKPVTDFGFWKYVMVPAPDDVLIELFQMDREKLPPGLADYFFPDGE